MRALILLLIFALGAFAIATKRLQTEQIAHESSFAASIADKIHDEQTEFVAGLEKLSSTISSFPSVQSRNKSESQHLLSAVASANSSIANIMISDAGGTVWASALPLPHEQSLTLRRYFRNALSSGLFSSGDYFDGGMSGAPLMGFAYPVKNWTGTVSNVIVVIAAMKMNSAYYHGDKPVADPSVLITDHSGIILTSSVKMRQAGEKEDPTLFGEMSKGNAEGIFEIGGSGGKQGIYHYRTVRLPHEKVPFLFIRVTVDKERIVNTSTSRAAWHTAAAVAVCLLSACCITLYVRRKNVIGSMRIFQDFADDIVQGNDAVRISDHVPNRELRGLVYAFDEIAGVLSEKTRALRYADTALKQSEKNYRELVEKARIIILKLDGEGKITFVNEYAQLYFGFLERELIGKPVVGTIIPEVESGARHMQEMITHLAQDPSLYASSITENIRKSGERVWVSWSSHMLAEADGGNGGMLAVGQDITDLIRMEESLRMSEQRFRSFVENASDVVFALTPAGIFTYVSPQWKECFGHELSEVIGKSFVPFVHPDDVPVCSTFLALVLQTGKKERGVEYRVRHKNGTWRWYTANGSCLVERDDTVSFIGIGRDITDKKRIQSEQVRAEKLESLNLLAGGIAHNFNNILTGVIGYIAFARKHLKDYDKTAPVLEAAEKSSYRAAGLARQLLTFSKGEVPFRRLTAAGKLVQESISLLLSDSKVEGTIKDRATLQVNVDCEHIKQAFNNVVLNAINSMPGGGVLTVDIDDILLEADNGYLLKAGDYVIITFNDSGSGIAKHHLDKIFDPYFTTRADGIGLGLAAAHAIVTKHEGNISVVSEINYGTTITIILPGFPEKSAGEPAEKDEIMQNAVGVTLLINE